MPKLNQIRTIEMELTKIIGELEERIRGPISFNSMMTKIEIAQEKHLKKTKRIKIGIKGKKPILSAVWMDKKGQILIKTRRIKNRAWRYARRKKAPEREIQILKRKYELQQKGHIPIPREKKGRMGK